MRAPRRLPADDGDYGDVTAWELGYLLLRLPSPDATRARARLARTLGEMRQRSPEDNMVGALDVILHGRDGAERSAYRPDKGGPISPFFLGHVTDDASFVAEHLTKGGGPDVSSWPNARLAFLGGDPVLAYERKYWSKYRGKGAHSYIVATFGETAAKSVRPMIAEMAKGSSAKREAAAWLERNA